jgi:glycosyltransferase involved in cell wall biosynthesis
MAAANVQLKGLDCLLQAMGEVRRGVPSAHLVVVSRAWDESGIPERLEELGLTGAVTHLCDLAEDQLGVEFSRSEVVVVPSLYEGFSLPAVQAMAAGVPLVVTTAGALPEVVGADGSTGVLVEPGQPQPMAEAITSLLLNRSLRTDLASAGRKRALARYNWHACGERTVAVYRELLV